MEFTREELAAQTLFREVDLDAVEPLLAACEVRRLGSGEVLISARQPNRNLYLVLSGRLSVRLRTQESVPLTTVRAGDGVGEVSLIDHQPASAYVVAEEPSRVLVIDEELTWLLVNTSHAISSNLLFTLAKRLRFGTDVIVEDQAQIAEYRFHATVDALTGLFNRHWLNIMLPRQMGRAKSAGENLSLMLADIDHFKRYNDEHGHLAGDRVLCAVATELRERLRPTDMAARFGGEEFVVLLPDCSLEGAQIVGERLREAIATMPVKFAVGAELPPVTVSIGVAQMLDEASPEALIHAADAALYRAKSDGRDQVAA